MEEVSPDHNHLNQFDNRQPVTWHQKSFISTNPSAQLANIQFQK